MPHAFDRSLLLVCACSILAACGGGGGAEEDSSPTPTTSFTQQATWAVTLPASGSSVCYDFNARAEVAGCAGNAWDLKLTVGSRGSASLWTNSGTSGTGAGGAFGGPFDHTWTELQSYTDATTCRPRCFVPTVPAGCFPAAMASSPPPSNMVWAAATTICCIPTSGCF